MRKKSKTLAQHYFRFLAIAAGVMMFGLVLSCGDEKKGLAEQCETDEDCASSLCSSAGLLNNQCTMYCDSTEECVAKFGKNSSCRNSGYCVLECAKDSDCPALASCSNDVFCTRF